MAVVGLLLLPSDYRAGAETTHAHSLVQLWADAADGSIHHHYEAAFSATHQYAVMSWFDPSVDVWSASEQSEVGAAQPDVAEQHDTAPAASGVHFLVGAVATIVFGAARRTPSARSNRRPETRFPRVLLPPPRLTAAAA